MIVRFSELVYRISWHLLVKRNKKLVPFEFEIFNSASSADMAKLSAFYFISNTATIILNY